MNRPTFTRAMFAAAIIFAVVAVLPAKVIPAYSEDDRQLWRVFVEAFAQTRYAPYLPD